MATYRTILNAAKKLHDKYTADQNHEGIVSEVLPQYHYCLNKFPDDAEILFCTATAEMQAGHNGAAIALFHRCMQKADVESPEVWNNLGTAYKREFMNDDAKQCFQKAIDLAPNRADYLSNMATIYINEGDPQKGLKYSSKAIEVEQTPKNGWNHSLLLLEAGFWEEGFLYYDFGLLSGERMNRFYGGIPAYQGGTLRNKTVLVYGEQGLGDEIMFASALSDLQHAIGGGHGKIVYDCHDRLEGVMRRSFPDIDVYPDRKKDDCQPWLDDYEFDYRIPIGSLFRWFGIHRRRPYLKPDPDLVSYYRGLVEAKGSGPYIGIAWSGGVKKTHAHARRIKLNSLIPLLRSGGEFFSLQYTPDTCEKVGRFRDDTGINIHHLQHVVEAGPKGDRFHGFDYDHTIALVAALDVVVAPNTSIVHVCGAIGKDCYTMTHKRCAWRYRNGDGFMPMYAHPVHVIETENEDMRDAIDNIVEELTDD